MQFAKIPQASTKANLREILLNEDYHTFTNIVDRCVDNLPFVCLRINYVND